mmetsp:Transcript_12317/g.51847  ORF Transcript_12317/g.51847 Transcript_12317/m.51847 type:complete len:361 (-) Transcript_12317:1079-2161(-)
MPRMRPAAVPTNTAADCNGGTPSSDPVAGWAVSAFAPAGCAVGSCAVRGGCGCGCDSVLDCGWCVLGCDSTDVLCCVATGAGTSAGAGGSVSLGSSSASAGPSLATSSALSPCCCDASCSSCSTASTARAAACGDSSGAATRETGTSVLTTASGVPIVAPARAVSAAAGAPPAPIPAPAAAAAGIGSTPGSLQTTSARAACSHVTARLGCSNLVQPNVAAMVEAWPRPRSAATALSAASAIALASLKPHNQATSAAVAGGSVRWSSASFQAMRASRVSGASGRKRDPPPLYWLGMTPASARLCTTAKSGSPAPTSKKTGSSPVSTGDTRLCAEAGAFPWICTSPAASRSHRANLRRVMTS